VTAPLPDATRFTPPAVYARWWQLTESCSGRTASFDAVHWYRVPGRLVPFFGGFVEGFWAQRGNRIVLADSVRELGATVRHEMLHALVQLPGHPEEFFVGRCAAILYCGACAAWTPPTRDFDVVPAESIRVSVRLSLEPREADGQRWLSLWVSATNERARAVVVTDPYRPTWSSVLGFDLRGPDGGGAQGDIASDSSTMFFQPLETKRRLYEFRVTDRFDLGSYHVSPGHYSALGRYGSQVSEPDTLTVVP
jgi:hypothetical protein